MATIKFKKRDGTTISNPATITYKDQEVKKVVFCPKTESAFTSSYTLGEKLETPIIEEQRGGTDREYKSGKIEADNQDEFITGIDPKRVIASSDTVDTGTVYRGETVKLTVTVGPLGYTGIDAVNNRGQTESTTLFTDYTADSGGNFYPEEIFRRYANIKFKSADRTIREVTNYDYNNNAQNYYKDNEGETACPYDLGGKASIKLSSSGVYTSNEGEFTVPAGGGSTPTTTYTVNIDQNMTNDDFLMYMDPCVTSTTNGQLYYSNKATSGQTVVPVHNCTELSIGGTRKHQQHFSIPKNSHYVVGVSKGSGTYADLLYVRNYELCCLDLFEENAHPFVLANRETLQVNLKKKEENKGILSFAQTKGGINLNVRYNATNLEAILKIQYGGISGGTTKEQKIYFPVSYTGGIELTGDASDDISVVLIFATGNTSQSEYDDTSIRCAVNIN